MSPLPAPWVRFPGPGRFTHRIGSIQLRVAVDDHRHPVGTRPALVEQEGGLGQNRGGLDRLPEIANNLRSQARGLLLRFLIPDQLRLLNIARQRPERFHLLRPLPARLGQPISHQFAAGDRLVEFGDFLLDPAPLVHALVGQLGRRFATGRFHLLLRLDGLRVRVKEFLHIHRQDRRSGTLSTARRGRFPGRQNGPGNQSDANEKGDGDWQLHGFVVIRTDLCRTDRSQWRQHCKAEGSAFPGCDWKWCVWRR